MSHSLRDEIEFELAELHNLLAEHADLFVEAQTAALRRSSITALGGVLHSFYTGIESIFERVEKAYGRPRRGASSWHRDLLEAMAGPGSDRPAVITTCARPAGGIPPFPALIPPFVCISAGGGEDTSVGAQLSRLPE